MHVVCLCVDKNCITLCACVCVCVYSHKLGRQAAVLMLGRHVIGCKAEREEKYNGHTCIAYPNKHVHTRHKSKEGCLVLNPEIEWHVPMSYASHWSLS
jgi:hypothetical protein